MMLPFAEPPRSVCILRLSAIGDTCHVVPIVRTLQQAWPATQLSWDLPLPAAARAYAERLIPDARPTLIINPCSRHALRNWRAARYAALAQHAASRHGMRVILAGGPSELERRTGAEIEQVYGSGLVNQIGKDTLPELLALLARARVLVSPDSGPVHMEIGRAHV